MALRSGGRNSGSGAREPPLDAWTTSPPGLAKAAESPGGAPAHNPCAWSSWAEAGRCATSPIPSRGTSLTALARKGRSRRIGARDRSGQRQRKAHPQRRLIPLGRRITATCRFHIRFLEPTVAGSSASISSRHRPGQDNRARTRTAASCRVVKQASWSKSTGCWRSFRDRDLCPCC